MMSDHRRDQHVNGAWKKIFAPGAWGPEAAGRKNQRDEVKDPANQGQKRKEAGETAIPSAEVRPKEGQTDNPTRGKAPRD